MAPRILEKVQQDDIPSGWRKVRLGDVAEVGFSSVDKKSVNGEVPVELCNYTDVFYNRRIRPEMSFMAATANPLECQHWALRRGDVLFTKDSETREEIGIPTYVTDDLPNVLCGYHLARARPRKDVVDGEYLSEALRSPVVTKQFSRIANGVTRFGLTLAATRSVVILLPPLPEQRAVAAVLDSIDEAIERAEAAIAATERLRDALLHELLTRGVPGWHTEWNEVPGIGTVPACWEVVLLGEVAQVSFSSVDKKAVDGEVPVQLCNYTDVFYNRRIHSGMSLMSATATDAERKRWNLKRGDVLFTKDSETPDEIGISANVAEDLPNILCGYHLGLARPIEHLANGAFLAETLRSPASQRQFSRIANGVTRFGLTLRATRSFAVALPTLAEQQAMVAMLDGVDSAIERERTEREGLQVLKESSADALLTGRMSVVGLS